MFRLDVYPATGDRTIITSFFTPDMTILNWSKRVSDAGTMTFSMPAFSTKATETNLKMYNQVRLWRRSRRTGEYLKVWTGYIEAKQQFDDTIEVLCVGMVKLLEKRLTTSSTAQDVNTTLNTMNTDAPTGITVGNITATGTADLDTGFSSIRTIIDRYADGANAEYEIDDEFAFNFVPLLGSDQSSIYTLVFRRDGSPGNTVQEVELGEDGERMVNRLTGVSHNVTNFGEYQIAYDHATSTYDSDDSLDTYDRTAITQSGSETKIILNCVDSQVDYGYDNERFIIEEYASFDDATTFQTLQSMADDFVNQRKIPLSQYRIKPELIRRAFDPASGGRQVIESLLDYNDVSVGDLITVQVRTENQVIDDTRRITEITVTVNEELEEEMRFTLTQAGVRLTAVLAERKEVEELQRRIALLESKL